MKTGLNHIVIGVGNYYIFAHLKLYLFINYNKNILNHNKNDTANSERDRSVFNDTQ